MMATTKAKQSEGKAILKQIYVNQRAFRQASEDNTYFLPAGPASKDNPRAFIEILIEIMPTAKYTYTIAGDATSFVATATANLDDDPTMDIWTMDDGGQLVSAPGNNDAID